MKCCMQCNSSWFYYLQKYPFRDTQSAKVKHSIQTNFIRYFKCQCDKMDGPFNRAKMCCYRNKECSIVWASAQENMSLGFTNNKGADQPVHPHSLISAYVIRLLESVLSKLAPSEISLF